MKKITRFITQHLPLVVGLGVFTLAVTVAAVAQNNGDETVKVKIVKIVDGDTTVIEKVMNEVDVSDFTKQFQDIKGKNVQVNINVESLDKDKKEKGKSAQSMNFNFNMDSTMARAFSKCRVFSDTGKCKKFVWNDTMMKNFPKDFDFKFDFDEQGLMNDLNFDFNIDTDQEGKTVIVRSGNGQTIVINGEGDDISITEDNDGKTKTQAKTIVINDDKNDKKKKVIVSTSVTVIDMDEKGPSGVKMEKKKSKEETNVNFYPNPSDGNFTLELELDGKEPAQVRITDIAGKEVYIEKITGNGKVSKNLNLDGKKGTFIVTIKQGNKTTNKKIIIE